MMRSLLAVDASGRAVAVACRRADGHVFTRRMSRDDGGSLVQLTDCLLAEAGIWYDAIEAVAYAAGPGSFTGVRLACAFAQGVAMARGLSVIPVSSLAALALAAATRGGGERIVAMIDARMNEVYATYCQVTMSPPRVTMLTEPAILAPALAHRLADGAIDSVASDTVVDIPSLPTYLVDVDAALVLRLADHLPLVAPTSATVYYGERRVATPPVVAA